VINPRPTQRLPTPHLSTAMLQVNQSISKRQDIDVGGIVGGRPSPSANINISSHVDCRCLWLCQAKLRTPNLSATLKAFFLPVRCQVRQCPTLCTRLAATRIAKAVILPTVQLVSSSNKVLLHFLGPCNVFMSTFLQLHRSQCMKINTRCGKSPEASSRRRSCNEHTEQSEATRHPGTRRFCLPK
jgi:hypothetical protein